MARWILLLSLLVGHSLFAPSASLSSTSIGVIAGRITGDGRPLAGVVVNLRPGEPGSSSGLTILARTRTDADGRYRFAGLEPGRYTIAPLAIGWVMSTTLRYSQAELMATIEEGENEVVLNIDLVRGGVITGLILNAAGRPAIDQSVMLENVEEAGASRFFASVLMAGTQTDDRGRYRIFGVPPGRYLVSAGHPSTFYPSGTDRAQATIVEVAAGGEVAGIDFRLVEREKEREKRFAVSGRVVDRDTGMPASRLGVISFNLQEGEHSRGPTGSTDWQGNFELRGLLPGRYRLIGSTDYEKYALSDPLDIEVREEDVTGVELRVGKGASVSGEVVLVGAADPKNVNISELLQLIVTVEAVVPGTGGYFRQVDLGPGGRFRMGGFPPGKIRIGIHEKPGVSGLWLVGAEQGSVARSLPLEVGQGEEVNNLRLLVARGKGAIRGRVNVVGGALPPSSRITVVAEPEDGSNLRSAKAGDLDDRGLYRIEGLLPGRYHLFAILMFSGPFPAGWGNRGVSSGHIVEIRDDQMLQADLTFDLSR